MALPPMNPDKTAAGIVVDPKTLERVVPTSARKDGSMRKELKIRPGFTPQEDVGRFRGSRQKAQDQAGPPKIPGSDRTRPPPLTGENPFVSSSSNSSSTKTKSQLKNEKRRANKKAGPPKNWDESDDEEDDGAIGDAFEAGDEARKSQGAQTKTEEPKREEPAWPVEDGGQGMVGEEGPGMDGDGGIPEDPVPVEPKPEMQDKEDGEGEGTTAILSPPPPGPSAKDPAAPSAPPPSNEPEWRTASNRRRPQQAPNQNQQKPHPIQGGRKGPIGLAHPPPIDSSTSKPRGGGQGRGQNRQRRPQASREQSQSQSQPQSQPQSSKTSTQEEKKEPRVRKEVKVRETGLGSLADRVKGLVISTQDDGKKKEKAAGAEPSA